MSLTHVAPIRSDRSINLSDEDTMALMALAEETKDADMQTKKGRYTAALKDVLAKSSMMIDMQEESSTYMRKNVRYVSILMLVLALLCGANFALNLTANEMSKETHVASGTLTDTDGQVVQVSSTDIGVRPASEAANARRLSTSESGEPLELTGSGGQSLYVNRRPRVVSQIQVGSSRSRRLAEDEGRNYSRMGMPGAEFCMPCQEVGNVVAQFEQGDDTFVASTNRGIHRFQVSSVSDGLLVAALQTNTIGIPSDVSVRLPYNGNTGECCGTYLSTISIKNGVQAGSEARRLFAKEDFLGSKGPCVFHGMRSSVSSEHLPFDCGLTNNVCGSREADLGFCQPFGAVKLWCDCIRGRNDRDCDRAVCLPDTGGRCHSWQGTSVSDEHQSANPHPAVPLLMLMMMQDLYYRGPADFIQAPPHERKWYYGFYQEQDMRYIIQDGGSSFDLIREVKRRSSARGESTCHLLAPCSAADCNTAGRCFRHSTMGDYKCINCDIDDCPLEWQEWVDNNFQACFPADARVRLVDGTTKSMKELGSGDVVETSTNLEDIGFEQWVLDFHGTMGNTQAMVHAEFIEISHEASPVPLRMTASHFLYASKLHGGAPTLVLAGDINVGETILVSNGTTLAPATVTGVQLVTGLGIYAPLTLSGRLVVDNVLVSSYAAPSHATAQAWKLFPTLPWETVFRSFCVPLCYYHIFKFPTLLAVLSEWWSSSLPSFRLSEHASVSPIALAAGRGLDALARFLLRFRPAVHCASPKGPGAVIDCA